MGNALRFTSWLAPGLPEGLFTAVAAAVGAELGWPTRCGFEHRLSGPMGPADDRFASGLTDVGFVCPPSFLWLSDRPDPSVVLVPRAPVFDDERARGRPVYFSDVVVRADDRARDLPDLAGRRIGYNDRSSLSGYGGLLAELARLGLEPSVFGAFDQVGGHREALARIVDGRLDAGAIDANVRIAWEREVPGRADRIRSIAVIGPHPVQPVVLASALADRWLGPLTAALGSRRVAEAVEPYGILGFATVDRSHYEAIRPTYRLILDDP